MAYKTSFKAAVEAGCLCMLKSETEEDGYACFWNKEKNVDAGLCEHYSEEVSGDSATLSLACMC